MDLRSILAEIGEFWIKIGCNLSILVDSKSIFDDLGSILVGIGYRLCFYLYIV